MTKVIIEIEMLIIVLTLVLRTILSKPRVQSMKKNRMAHKGDMGIWAIPSE